VKNVFFGETGPVAVSTAAMLTLEADAGKSQHPEDLRTPTSRSIEGNTEPRVAAAHHRVSVANMDDATWVVQLDQAILGYVHRAGTVYVALRGATLGLAVEVGQSVSRARAFMLLHSDLRVETSTA
jgi:hypothetical protein